MALVDFLPCMCWSSAELLRATLCPSPGFSFCAALSFLVVCCMNSGYFGLPRLLSLLLQRCLRLLPQFPFVVPWPASSQVSKGKKWKSLSRADSCDPGQNTGVGSCNLLQGIFPAQGLNWGLLHCRHILPSEPPGKLLLTLFVFCLLKNLCPFWPEVQWLESSVFEEFCFLF